MNPSLSRVFITIQYTACIVLVIFAIVIARQVEFVYNKDLGFDKEQTMIITNPYWGDKERRWHSEKDYIVTWMLSLRCRA